MPTVSHRRRSQSRSACLAALLWSCNDTTRGEPALDDADTPPAREAAADADLGGAGLGGPDPLLDAPGGDPIDGDRDGGAGCTPPRVSLVSGPDDQPIVGATPPWAVAGSARGFVAGWVSARGIELVEHAGGATGRRVLVPARDVTAFDLLVDGDVLEVVWAQSAEDGFAGVFAARGTLDALGEPTRIDAVAYCGVVRLVRGPAGTKLVYTARSLPGGTTFDLHVRALGAPEEYGVVAYFDGAQPALVDAVPQDERVLVAATATDVAPPIQLWRFDAAGAVRAGDVYAPPSGGGFVPAPPRLLWSAGVRGLVVVDPTDRRATVQWVALTSGDAPAAPRDLQARAGWAFETGPDAVALATGFAVVWSDFRDTFDGSNYAAARAVYFNRFDAAGAAVTETVGAEGAVRAPDRRLSEPAHDATWPRLAQAGDGSLGVLFGAPAERALYLVEGDLECAPLVEDHGSQRGW